ncbi:MAG: hypothetical protein K6T92_08310 [Candidatus Rokubacteria bacterium]|nr:hypothetical protein [Candidatus Rokubacteria bacterium]
MLDQLTPLLRQLTISQRIGIVFGAIASALLLVGLVLWAGRTEYQPAFTRLAASDAAGGGQQARHRPHHVRPEEERDHEPEGEDGEAADRDGGGPQGRQAAIDLGQAHRNVHHAEHPLRRRVDVARGGGAARLVVDRPDQAERAMPAALEDPAPRRQVRPDDGLVGGVAGVARLGALVDEASDLPPARREGDAPLLVEDPDDLDPRLLGDGLHDLIGVGAAIGQHVVVRAEPDGLGEHVRAADDHVDEVALLRAHHEREEDRDGREREHGDGRGQAHAEPHPPADEELVGRVWRLGCLL